MTDAPKNKSGRMEIIIAVRLRSYNCDSIAQDKLFHDPNWADSR
jgi:hypothetical protein